MKLTVCLTTARKSPLVAETAADLVAQRRPDDRIDLVIVDFFERTVLELGIDVAAFGQVTCVAPKPTPWQGRHRLARRDMWAMSSARNTAMIYAPADADYCAFLDDRVRLGPTWLDAVRAGELDRKSVICGPYDKREHVPGSSPGPDGAHPTRVSIDHRSQHAPHGRRNCGGSWLYGGNFAMPLAWALAVGGFEEGCDAVGGEDYVFGAMLQNAGRRIDFVARMAAMQDRVCQDHPMPRDDKGISPRDKSHACRSRYLPRRHTDPATTPSIVDLRRRALVAEPIVPWWKPDLRDWYDGTLVSENG